MAGKGLEDPTGPADSQWWAPGSTAPVGEPGCQAGHSEQRGWKRPGHHSACFGYPSDFELTSPCSVSVPCQVTTAWRQRL